MKQFAAGLAVALLVVGAMAQSVGPVADNEIGNSVFFAVKSTRTYWQGPITFENSVVVNSLSVGPQEGCAPGPNGTRATYNGYLFFGHSPLNVNPAAPCINVDSSAGIPLPNGIYLVAGGATAILYDVAFSGVDQAGNSFHGHFELIETTHYGCSGGRGGGCHTTAYLWPSAPEYNSNGTPHLDANGAQIVYHTKVVFDNYTPAR
jgi:hypothetical protein